VKSAVLLLALGAVGCNDVFALSSSGDGSMGGGDMTSGGGDLAGGGGSGGGDGGTVSLPASCSRLSCTPATNEGDVGLDDTSGVLSGCHAYRNLTISETVHVTQFAACAESIMIGGTLDANGGGFAANMGTGAGGICPVQGTAGGGHGGAGGDPSSCGGGTTYGDSMHPREAGSGGGGTGAGSGGGVIELAATTLNLLSLIRASGGDGSGVSAGGGAGGSVLIDIDQGIGAGRIEAIGGNGVGVTPAGGGGGGRVAVYTSGAPVGFSIVVDGGKNSSGGGTGGAGTSMK